MKIVPNTIKTKEEEELYEIIKIKEVITIKALLLNL